MLARLHDELVVRGMSPTLMAAFAFLAVAAIGLAVASLPTGPAQVIQAAVTDVVGGGTGRQDPSPTIWIEFNGRPLAIKVPVGHGCVTGDVGEFYVFTNRLGGNVVKASPGSCRHPNVPL